VEALALGYHRAHDQRIVIAGAAVLSAAVACLVAQHPDLVNFDGVASLRGVALLVTGLAAGAVCLRYPDVALCCLVAFVCLNLSDVLVRGHGLPSLLQVVFIPVALSGWWHAAAGRRALPHVLALLLAAYLVVMLWSTTLAADRAVADARLLEHLRGFAICSVVVMLGQSAHALRRAAWTFVGSAALLSGLALVQIATNDFTYEFGGLARIKYAQIYGTTFEPRIAGPLGDPNFFAQILLLSVPVALQLAWTTRGVSRMLGFIAAGMAGVATVFTYSRGGALALGAVLLLSVIVRGIDLRKMAVISAAFVLVLWVALPGEFARRLTTLSQLVPGSEEVLRPDSSFGERKMFAAAAWGMFQDHMITGVGAGNYGLHFLDYAQRVGSDARLYVTPTEGYYPHNLYLEVAAETGLAGVVPFGLTLVVCFLYLSRARRTLLASGDVSSAGLAAGWSIALGGYLLTSLFLHGDFIRYWWLMVGFAGAFYRLTSLPHTPHVVRPPSPLAVLTTRQATTAAEPGVKYAPSAVRPAVAVIMSRFPLITETFILREVIEMERQGQPVLLVPLIHEHARVIHREAEPWVARALYTPFVSVPIVVANVRMLRRRPWRYAKTLLRVTGGTLADPTFCVRSLALFPKAVYLADRLERDGVQHVHAHYATHPATVALIISSLTKVTFSFTVHAHDIFVRRLLLAWKLEAAVFVRSISRFNRQFLADRYAAALVRKIQVIHVGIETDGYRPSAALPDTNCRPHILCVASLQPYKGIPVLLDACDVLQRRGVDFTCTMVGEGRMRPALEAQLQHLRLEERVTLAGARPQHEVAALMRTASLLVMPSVIAHDGQMEGIPVAVMEAMASALPVVASSLSGLPEAVDESTGRLVAPGHAGELANAIEQVLANPSAAREMGERGRVVVQREFQLETCVRELLQHVDRWNPPPVDAESLLRSVRRSGIGAGSIGVRRRIERPDSRIVHLLVKNGHGPHDAILKFHASRAGESRPAAERARREFDALVQLERMSTNGSRVPGPLHLDPDGASLLMEPCRGTPLDALIRNSRFARDGNRARTLITAVQGTGSWLRHFQEATANAHRRDAAPALTQLVETAAAHLERCRGGALSPSAVEAVRSQLEGLKARLAPASLRVTSVHGDFWPGNVFAADDVVEVIDFEGMRDGLPYEDVAYFLVQLEQFFPGPVLRAQFKPLGAAFLAGYLPENDGFDWPAYELCRIATALRMLSTTPRGFRARWRQRMLRNAIIGGAA
jgi:glycosyltransferase involved in cell wall biosynthesis/O-antigen ligase